MEKKLYKPMQKKTINQVIIRKINDWLKYIDDEELVKELKKDIIVTGGCIPSMMLGEKVNDFDIYIRTLETLEKLSNYYINKFQKGYDGSIYLTYKKSRMIEDKVNIDYSFPSGLKSIDEEGNVIDFDFKFNPDFKKLDYQDLNNTVAILVRSEGVATKNNFNPNEDSNLDNTIDDIIGIEKEETDNVGKYRPVFMSENAITLSDKIQIVTRFWGKPEDIHANYDYLHVQNYWTFDEGVVMNLETNEAIRTKTLVYKGSRYPVASIIRSRKFVQRGWTCTAGQYLKMMLNLRDFDLTDFDTLRDQLTGVDLLYFQDFIAKLERAKEEGKVINNTYIISMLDRFF